MKIEKKVWPESFERISKGDVKFDLRLADFECAPGDILVYREYDPSTKNYTGRSIEKEIKHVEKTEVSKFYTKEQMDEFGLQTILF